MGMTSAAAAQPPADPSTYAGYLGNIQSSLSNPYFQPYYNSGPNQGHPGPLQVGNYYTTDKGSYNTTQAQPTPVGNVLFDNPRDAQAYQGVSNAYQAANSPEGKVLQTYADLYAQAQQDVANYGTTEQAQLANSYAMQSAQQQQGLQARGLGNTTVSNAVQTGLGQAQNLAQTNLAEQIGQYKTNTVQAAGGQLAGAQLGIYQQQTDLNSRMQQQVAQINASAAAQQREIAAQSLQQSNQFNYATALAAQQYGYNSNLQQQQIGLQNKYQQQLLQMQMANQSMSHPSVVYNEAHTNMGL